MPTAARSAFHRDLASRERLRPPRLRAATRARAAEMPTEISAAPVSYSRSLQPVCTASHRRNPPTLGSQPTSAGRAHGWVMRGPPPPTAATTAAAVAMVPRHQARWWQGQPWRPRRSYLRGCRWRGRRCSSCSRSAGPAHRVRCGECGGEEDSTRDPHNLPRGLAKAALCGVGAIRERRSQGERGSDTCTYSTPGGGEEAQSQAGGWVEERHEKARASCNRCPPACAGRGGDLACRLPARSRRHGLRRLRRHDGHFPGPLPRRLCCASGCTSAAPAAASGSRARSSRSPPLLC